MSNKFVLLLIFFLFFCKTLFSQQLPNANYNNPCIIHCQEVSPTSAFFVNSSSMGYSKPERTDYTWAASDAYFPVMVIFVQFANDPGPDASYWPKWGAPDYLNTIISQTKKYPIGSNWWDTYSESTEYLSDFWMEQSRGHFHVAGSVFNIVLDNDYLYYELNGGEPRVNDDIYQKLNSLYSIDWRTFDKWTMIVNSDGSYIYDDAPDGFVDMIYKVHRSHAPIPGMPAGGIAVIGESYSQGYNYLIDPVNGIYINSSFGSVGSGITLTPGYGGTIGSPDYAPNPPLTRRGMVSFSGHEHGHYLFGPSHGNYGKMMGGDYGIDECLSPWESVRLGYGLTKKVNYNVSDYAIGDFSSRTADLFSEILEVPIVDSTEFFLIASRRKVSYYDRIMWGDTAHDDPYRNINPEYGKGVYIYHTPSGYLYPPYMDQECADGLYNYVVAGYEHPDWSNEQLLPFYNKESVSYNNDKSLGRLTDADGKSIFGWLGVGKKHSCQYCDGTDRIYTNNTEIWTSREGLGDRWDAWNVGYNEVFSPYSSPSTKNWNSAETGIFVWYYELDQFNNVKFKIFRAGYGGYSEADILKLTPPSRPMGLKVSLSDCIDDFYYPVLTWVHNMEPDMVHQQMPLYDGKIYKIYFARATGNIVPEDYIYLATVNMDTSRIPQYVDFQHPIDCGPQTESLNLRYVITAVDNTRWESVRSDFAAITVNASSSAFAFTFKNMPPSRYTLFQNYPNPFNPSTLIKFDIPTAGHVKLTIYNLLGEEIAVLVDENRPAGRYSAVFNGYSLPSGVYFYKIEASTFIDSKKMVLVK